MNTNRIHQIRTATVATVVAFIACAITATPAFATHTHDEGDGSGGTAITALSPYSVPTAALAGMTLALYIQHHQAGDPRTATIV